VGNPCRSTTALSPAGAFHPVSVPGCFRNTNSFPPAEIPVSEIPLRMGFAFDNVDAYVVQGNDAWILLRYIL
jgi:hypothetical protein